VSGRFPRLARDLHPVAWWIWALGLATAASLTTNPWLLLLLMASAALVVAARRGDQPWADSFRLYCLLGLAIVVIRVAFRIVFGAVDSGPVWLDLPSIPLPDWVAGLNLLGPVTRDDVLGGLYDGLRLAGIVVCVGAANSLANPKRLLASLPAALYEVGTALVVAVTVFPQLADSVRRVRAAQELRGGDDGRMSRLRRSLVPVLEDALGRSLALAAGMDARGYGRAPASGRSSQLLTGGLLLGGLVGLCVGTYAVLDQTAPRWLAAPMLLLGAAAATVGLWAAGSRVQRSRYRPDRWRPAELGLVAVGVTVGAAGWWIAEHQVLVAHPGLETVPVVSGLALAMVLVAALPAVLTPPPAGRR